MKRSLEVARNPSHQMSRKQGRSPPPSPVPMVETGMRPPTPPVAEPVDRKAENTADWNEAEQGVSESRPRPSEGGEATLTTGICGQATNTFIYLKEHR